MCSGIAWVEAVALSVLSGGVVCVCGTLRVGGEGAGGGRIGSLGFPVSVRNLVLWVARVLFI